MTRTKSQKLRAKARAILQKKVVAKAGAKRPRRRRPGAKSMVKVKNPYLSVLSSPFSCPPVHVPDDESSSSGVGTARHTSAYSATASAASTTFDVLITMSPFLGTYMMSVYSKGNADAAWTAPTSVLWPNKAALTGAATNDQIRSRLVSMGMKITPTTPELYRGGRVHVIQSRIGAGYATATPALFGPLKNSTSTTVGAILNDATIRHSSRVEDGSIISHWIPTGRVPYMVSNATTAISNNTDINTYSAVDLGEYNTLSVLFEGLPIASDTASVSGPSYEVDCIAHFEVIPPSLFGVTYAVEPSLCDPVQFAQAKNLILRTAQAAWSGQSATGGTLAGSGPLITSDVGSTAPPLGSGLLSNPFFGAGLSALGAGASFLPGLLRARRGNGMLDIPVD